MKILIAGLAKKRQFLRLNEEGVRRGHIVEGCLASDLIINTSEISFEPILQDGRRLQDYNLIYLIVGARLWEWYTAAGFVNKKYKTVIVNRKAIDPDYHFFLSPAIDYLRLFENSLPFPKSSILFSSTAVDKVAKEFAFPLILKTSQGHRGEGVYKVENIADLKIKIDEITQNMKSCVIREFIPNDGDIRVFVVGYHAIGGMVRTPKEGEFRSNISQGGAGSVFNLEKNTEIRKLAEKASPPRLGVASLLFTTKSSLE